MNKDAESHRKYFPNSRKARPNARKTNPKVLLVTPAKRPNFELRHPVPRKNLRRFAMQWINPDFCDLRLGFEVTAYVYVR